MAFVLLPHSFAHALTALLSVCVQNFVAVIWFHNVNYFLALQSSHMNILSFQITGNSTVCLTVWSRWQQRNHSGPLLALCEGKPWVTNGFHTQRASNAGNVSMPRYHDNSGMIHMIRFTGKHDFKQIWRQIFETSPWLLKTVINSSPPGTKWPPFWLTFSNEFSWMKMVEFWFIFHWNLFPRVQLTIWQHWLR